MVVMLDVLTGDAVIPLGIKIHFVARVFVTSPFHLSITLRTEFTISYSYYLSHMYIMFLSYVTAPPPPNCMFGKKKYLLT